MPDICSTHYTLRQVAHPLVDRVIYVVSEPERIMSVHREMCLLYNRQLKIDTNRQIGCVQITIIWRWGYWGRGVLYLRILRSVWLWSWCSISGCCSSPFLYSYLHQTSQFPSVFRAPSPNICRSLLIPQKSTQCNLGRLFFFLLSPRIYFFGQSFSHPLRFSTCRIRFCLLLTSFLKPSFNLTYSLGSSSVPMSIILTPDFWSCFLSNYWIQLGWCHKYAKYISTEFMRNAPRSKMSPFKPFPSLYAFIPPSIRLRTPVCCETERSPYTVLSSYKMRNPKRLPV